MHKIITRSRIDRSMLPFLLFAVALTLLRPDSCRAHDTSHAKPHAVKASSVESRPAPGFAAPAFRLPDVEGKTHALADYRGQAVVLYSFCGCGWCHKCALAWGKIQRSGALAQTGAQQGQTPLTLVLFHGDAEETREFATDTQLDLKHTVLLPDVDEKVSQLYQAVLCPRVFVVDSQGIIRYTNNEKGKDSYKIPAPLIVARTVDALRRVSTKPAAPQPVTGTAAPTKIQKGNKAQKN